MRRREVGSLAIALLAGLVGCNAITGAHDRMLAQPAPDDSDDGGPFVPKGRSDGGSTSDGAADAEAPPDAHPERTITLGKTFSSVNNATATVVADGVKITAVDATAAHAIIIPMPAPNLPTSDFTVVATLRADQDGEYGLVTRIRADGSGFLIGSKFGVPQMPAPFVGFIAPADWNPSLVGTGTEYTFAAGTKYKMKLVAQDKIISGKMWRADGVEPDTSIAVTDTAAPGDRGRTAGFYTYGVVDVTLLDLTITYVSP